MYFMYNKIILEKRLKMFVNGTQPKKDDVVQTPEWLINRIYKQISRKQYKNILDIGAYDGALSRPFTRIKGSHRIGVDILNDYSDNFDHFIHEPFLNTTEEVYKNKPDLIIMNPPFSDIQPMRFIEHCNALFGSNIPIIIIVPTYIMDNSKKRSHELNKLNITRTIVLDTYTFGEAARIHTQLLFINIPFRKKSAYEYWYKPKEQKKKGKYRSVYMNKKDEENIQILLKKYGGNFNKMIKSLITNEVERV